ncbi:DUF4306 domain-containing protein [Aquibacillus rhizosphaerae]|uniref:DUF4306 domain-containing protein n=1 Tax=Aquibacillus rhizosphaerae TaxID=3051431 RepID=A0ABT7L117_9BACI|nr:DUF4306 domain-containing protein [Aquibacillus sp. LR5S19]MDL4839489.1 DUF4306 domain-containing protein [Aquibacillus sp. LR5S19]
MKYIIQYLLALIVLFLSSLAAWYEGSAIRDNPWEWNNSTFFSTLLNGEIKDTADISQLDHFIYAAKFSPIFPILIVCSHHIFYFLVVIYFLEQIKIG